MTDKNATKESQEPSERKKLIKKYDGKMWHIEHFLPLKKGVITNLGRALLEISGFRKAAEERMVIEAIRLDAFAEALLFVVAYESFPYAKTIYEEGVTSDFSAIVIQARKIIESQEKLSEERDNLKEVIIRRFDQIKGYFPEENIQFTGNYTGFEQAVAAGYIKHSYRKSAGKKDNLLPLFEKTNAIGIREGSYVKYDSIPDEGMIIGLQYKSDEPLYPCLKVTNAMLEKANRSHKIERRPHNGMFEWSMERKVLFTTAKKTIDLDEGCSQFIHKINIKALRMRRREEEAIQELQEKGFKGSIKLTTLKEISKHIEYHDQFSHEEELHIPTFEMQVKAIKEKLSQADPIKPIPEEGSTEVKPFQIILRGKKETYPIPGIIDQEGNIQLHIDPSDPQMMNALPKTGIAKTEINGVKMPCDLIWEEKGIAEKNARDFRKKVGGIMKEEIVSTYGLALHAFECRGCKERFIPQDTDQKKIDGGAIYPIPCPNCEKPVIAYRKA